MTIRQNIPPPEPGTEQLPNGYSGSDQPSEFTIPPCGIDDVDGAVFALFDQELGFATQKLVNGSSGQINIKKPTVVFATGEKFATVKRLRPLRDRNRVLILPAISIRRTAIQQSDVDMASRGMNQTTGELIIKRRLDSSDRSYQNFLNKLLLQHSDVPATRRPTGENNGDVSIQQGMLLDPRVGNNVFEIIAIPQPQFYQATYEVVFWTSYTEHMNYLIETLLSSQLPQAKTFKLVTDKGYWFIATLEDQAQSQDNFDSFEDEERIVRYSVNLKVDAFLLATNGPGRPVPFKRYVSAPTISFEVINDTPPTLKTDLQRNEDQDRATGFILSDTETAASQAPTTLDRYVFQREVVDPRTGKKKLSYVKIADRNNRRGETVYTASDQETLAEFLLSGKSNK